MRSQIVAELLREYAAVRAEALARAEEVRLQIAERVPLYADLGAELARVMALCAQNGEDAAARVYALKEDAEGQLRAAGYAPDDLRPKFRCEACRDTGYVGEPVHRFCACFERALQGEVIRRSGLGSAPDHNFEHFDVSVFPAEGEGRTQRQTMERLCAFSRNWAEQFPKNKRTDIVLCGPTGLGKTFLLDCVAARVIERGFSVLRITAFRLMEAMRLRHMGRDDGDMMNVMLGVDLLYIDDLGTEPLLENITIEYLFTVLNERQQMRLSTAVATNLTPAQLRARYTERITSRLLNAETGALFLLEGKDVRMRRE